LEELSLPFAGDPKRKKQFANSTMPIIRRLESAQKCSSAASEMVLAQYVESAMGSQLLGTISRFEAWGEMRP
jgi:hypothetical protein